MYSCTNNYSNNWSIKWLLETTVALDFLAVQEHRCTCAGLCRHALDEMCGDSAALFCVQHQHEAPILHEDASPTVHETRMELWRSAGVFWMMSLCIKLLSTGSAMMWEGGWDTERRIEGGGGRERGGRLWCHTKQEERERRERGEREQPSR